VVHGGNGAGKTTLLRMVAGVLRPRAGRVRREGRVGYLPQRSDEPPPRLAPAVWLEALSRMAGSGAGAGQRELLAALGVDRLTAPLDTLSVGTVAKVLLAGALGGAPGVLVLDEPFAALDTTTRAATLSLIASAARDGAVVVVSDHEGAATEVATHVGTIAGGRLSVQRAPGLTQRVRILGTEADGTTVDRIVPAGERDALLLHLLRDGGSVRRVEDVP